MSVAPHCGTMTLVARSDAADALDGISWQQFEALVGEGFRLQGYRVVQTGGGSKAGIVLGGLALAGGAESMSRGPYWLPQAW